MRISTRISVIGITVLCIFLCVSAALAQKQRLSIGTAGTTGVFYSYGGALANLISKYVAGVSSTAEATGGSVENMRLIENKEIDIATTSADTVYQAYYDYKKSKYFKKKVDVTGLFNMYTQPHHIITLKNSDIKKVEDIRGKRVSVGSPGSGTEVKTRMLLNALGITYKDFQPEFLSFGESVEALQDKNIECAFLGVSYPAPAVINLALTNKIRLVSLSDEEIGKIISAYPFLSKSIIPKDVYKDVSYDTTTIAVQTLVVCRPDLSPDLTYQIVKAVFEHKDDLNLIHSSFRETTLEHATPTVVPTHPGAIKYFKETNVYKEKQYLQQ